MGKYLCLIINRSTGKEIKEYTCESIDQYFAKHKATKLFKKDQRYQPKLRRLDDWYADACKI